MCRFILILKEECNLLSYLVLSEPFHCYICVTSQPSYYVTFLSIPLFQLSELCQTIFGEKLSAKPLSLCSTPPLNELKIVTPIEVIFSFNLQLSYSVCLLFSLENYKCWLVVHGIMKNGKQQILKGYLNKKVSSFISGFDSHLAKKSWTVTSC